MITFNAETAEKINQYIQPLRGKNIQSEKVEMMFPETADVISLSKEINDAKKYGDTHYSLFINGKLEFSTWSYDDASDFLLDTPNSQGFQISYLTGLSVCADQAKI